MTVFRNVLNFLNFNTVKSKMKSLVERNGCDNCSCRSGDSLIFFHSNVSSLRKLIISKVFTLLTYFSTETTKVLGKVQLLVPHQFLVLHQYSKFIYYQRRVPSFSWVLYSFFSRHTNILVHLNISLSTLKYRCFMFELYSKFQKSHFFGLRAHCHLLPTL